MSYVHCLLRRSKGRAELVPGPGVSSQGSLLAGTDGARGGLPLYRTLLVLTLTEQPVKPKVPEQEYMLHPWPDFISSL